MAIIQGDRGVGDAWMCADQPKRDPIPHGRYSVTFLCYNTADCEWYCGVLRYVERRAASYFELQVSAIRTFSHTRESNDFADYFLATVLSLSIATLPNKE